MHAFEVLEFILKQIPASVGRVHPSTLGAPGAQRRPREPAGFATGIGEAFLIHFICQMLTA
jgi:hypothetical protein